MTSAIPARSPGALTGSQFVAQVRESGGPAREGAIESELLGGNVPRFLRGLKPIGLDATTPDGRHVSVTVCVTPDYLAIGSDRDFLHVPMALPTALHVAEAFGFVLPTRRIVDAVYRQAEIRFRPEPLPAGDEMRSTAYYANHDLRIAAQRSALGAGLGELMAGHKKDLVTTKRLRSNPERVAIYGWHRADGQPIQPLSTVHGARYADYSHGVRLVSVVAYVDGRPRSLIDALQDPRLAPALSDEGPIARAAELMSDGSGSAEEPSEAVAQKASDLTGLVARALSRD